MLILKIKTLLLLFSVSSCAVLHHVQVDEIDQRFGKLKPFDIKVSETGVNFKEAGNFGQSVFKKPNPISKAQKMISLFQMGPKTGNHVFNDTYAENLAERLYEVCPSGRVTGLVSMRESKKYPVISGEIVRLTGYCIQ